MSTWQQRMNHLGQARTPFLFVIDFEQRQPLVLPLSEVDPAELRYDFRGVSNGLPKHWSNKKLILERSWLDAEVYRRSFNYVQQQLQRGNSFLVNLTFPTEIRINLSLLDLFCRSQAPYRLWWNDAFVVFSPECFVRIAEGQISTYPMKGTIDASLPDAEHQIRHDPKEMAEHATIVDLLRNDLSRHATQVRVERFRYVEEVATARAPLLQVSSEIVGQLPPDFHHRLGDLLGDLLPAGSVSGAPKSKTLQIIREAEPGPRGYYTGVMGYFDGERLDSAVMIRFIERVGERYFYRSGGGVTARSVPEAEYQELHDKVYVPV
ncbi:MAG: aminodeoxychorismate synthase component I [Tunicatimonas sp.]